VVPTEKEVRDPAALCRIIQEHEVTTLLCIPTLYRSILDAATGSQLESLQSVIVAGESCPSDLVDLHRKRSEEVPLFNEYGPTEASVWATVHRCVGDDTQGLVPIGRPIANTKALILDAQKRPVPPLVVGQIYIAGLGVAAGYLNRDELTRERFVELDLPGTEQPTRAYATGDLGRWRSDGSIEFLGRDDDQVKVSGFRIELAEIEAALRSQPAVEEAAVSMVSWSPKSPGTDSEHALSEKRIVGFYRIRETTQSPISSSELRQYLAEKLPVFMLPTSLVELSELPRQPNGKLDRIALAERAQTAVAAAPTEPPANAVEAQLMRIWLELIEVPRIDRHSNFFEIGGHSLLIPSLIERVHQDFDVELPLGVIFEAPTIAELARVVEAGDPRDSWKSLVSIRSGGDRRPLYLVHGLAGEISYFYNLVRYLEPDRPVYGLQAPAAPFDQMEPMASHYLQEIRQVQPEGPYLLGGYCLGGCVAYEMARQLVEAREEVQVLALFNSVPPRHIIGDSAPLATILARRLKRFASKGPKSALASLANLKKIKGHFDGGLRDDRQGAEVTLDDLISGIHAAYRGPASCHYRALRDYRPEKYPGNAWLFRGPDLYLGADFGWKMLIKGELEIEAIEGHHETVLKEPNVRGAAEKLAAVLEGLPE
jgi:thioesterase domain-containing protein